MPQNLHKILEITENGIVIALEEGKTMTLAKHQLPKRSQVGDYARHCEHGMFDLVDENGEFVRRLCEK